jgi:hypothetical protein
MVASFTFHPGGKDSPAGTLKVALPPSRVRMSTIAPPGTPFAGSSRLPIGGKRKFGSFETKTNFSLPDDAIFKISLTALIDWSAARATPATASMAHTASPILTR